MLAASSWRRAMPRTPARAPAASARVPRVAALASRRAWLDELAVSPGPDAWVAVTHGGVIRALVGGALGWNLRPPAPWRLLPERLHRLRRRRDGHLQVVTLNEPLRPGESP